MQEKKISSGIEGLDEITHGGFSERSAHLVRGGPGSGKTTVGLHFLEEGISAGEKVVFVALSEPISSVKRNAESIGISTKGIEFVDLLPSEDIFSKSETYDIFSPAEVERAPTTKLITEMIDTHKPTRVFVDSITQFRYLSTDSFQFRKQILSFIRYLSEHGTTSLLSSEGSSDAPDDDLQFMCDSVTNLEATAEGTREIYLSKYRGSSFQAGHHSYKIYSHGMEVYPRLVPGSYKGHFTFESISSGIPELDQLLHGGVERGTVTVIAGPTGTGKTTVGLQFMKEAAGRSERSVIYSFEEEPEIALRRSEAIGIPARTMSEKGTLLFEKIEPMAYSPDQFAQKVRKDIEENGTKIVMLDSLSGYSLTMGQEQDLVPHIHALVSYMANMGVTVFLVNEKRTVSTGDFQATELGLSYLVDNIIFLRYLEAMTEHGVELRKIIGVLKKRLSDFEKTVREMEITSYGIIVHEPMMRVSKIISGMPTLEISDRRDSKAA